MTITLQKFNHSRVRTDLPDIKSGHVVRVYQKITEIKGSGKKQETKERVQIFEGLVIGKKGGKGINATITVRKISGGIGVERVFPLNAPTIEKIELIKITKARRAKLNYMRDRIGKATKPKGEMVKQEEDKPSSDKSEDLEKDDKKEAVEVKTEKVIAKEENEIEKGASEKKDDDKINSKIKL
ncbi:50S ribosomal protein L19 [Candidatus Parcubacteria bacterium]|nr:50S ribosomal protein L19 [Candidatus Parcubacteria bacterium]